MRIKLTSVQVDTLREYLPDWCESADIVLGKTYADIEDHDVAEVYAAMDDAISRRAVNGAVAWRVHAALREAMPVGPDGVRASEGDDGVTPVNGAELPAERPDEVPEGDGPGVTPEELQDAVNDALARAAESERRQAIGVELPHPVMMSAAAIARGEYGDEAKRLAESMDDRPGERQTRWLARLRHKLNSAGLFEAADAIRLVPDV